MVVELIAQREEFPDLGDSGVAVEHVGIGIIRSFQPVVKAINSCQVVSEDYHEAVPDFRNQSGERLQIAAFRITQETQKLSEDLVVCDLRGDNCRVFSAKYEVTGVVLRVVARPEEL